ncbi:MAG: AEC family transporter [Rickettsiales bacterium]|nr:AEC family transporter [Rickettsiales bacterium]
MFHIVISIAPVFIIIMLGSIFKMRQMPGDAFWPLAERFTYYILLPVLFFRNVTKADFTTIDIATLLNTMLLATAIMAGLMLFLQYIIKMDGPSFTSVFQGGIRFNNYVGIPSAVALYPDEGFLLSATLIAIMVPIINSSCVAVLNHYGSNQKANFGRSVIRILTNPLIVACFVGIFFNLLNITIPYVVDEVLKALGNAALAFGLLCVGAGLDIKATKGKRHYLAKAVFLKLIIFPVITLICCMYMNVSSTTAIVAVLYMALPTAGSSYIMARQLGGNAPLMSGILVAQTLCAAVTLPIMIMLAEYVFALP